MTREHERRRKKERLRGAVAAVIADAHFPDRPYDELLAIADTILVGGANVNLLLRFPETTDV